MFSDAYEVYTVRGEVCDAWIAGVRDDRSEYSYGGTRMVPPDFDDDRAEESLVRLMFEESHLKNRLVNIALASDLLEDLEGELPPGYSGSWIGGGRCIMRPKEAHFEILQDPGHPDFPPLIEQVFREIGDRLNEIGGSLKLTPDFGRFEGLADHLHHHTEHVLGVRCSAGGCGGKGSYTTSGILGGLRTTQVIDAAEAPDQVTLIGAAGTLGSGVLAHLTRNGSRRSIGVSDLVWENGDGNGNGHGHPPGDLQHLPAEPGRFTDPCLRRGGTLIMTTWGQELENSDWEKIPQGTHLMLAHNLSMPEGDAGTELARRLADREIFCLPGQMLTLGGALTSRLEWFWRQARPGEDFTPKKALAHRIAERVVSFTVSGILERAQRDDTTPYEAMWSYAMDG